MKRLIALLLALVCLCSLNACSAQEANETHTFGELTVTVPTAYVPLHREPAFADYDFIFGDGVITLAGIREEKSLLPGLTLHQYGDLVIRAHRLDCQLLESDGITYFNYEAGLPSFTYVVSLWETPEAFWSVQVYCQSEDYATAREMMWQLLQSVTL